VIIDCAHYRAGKRQHDEPLEIGIAARHAAASGEGEFVWLGLRDPTAAELAEAQREFGLNELAVEDAREAHQRPKIEEYDGSFFIVLKTARYDDEREAVDFGEIDLFLGRGYAIVVRQGEASDLRPARSTLEDHPDLLALGPAAVAWAVMDKIVDDYAPVVEGIDNDIGEVEESVFSGGEDVTQRIYFLNREVIAFQRAVAPLRTPLEVLEAGGFPQVPNELRSYFRDVADHARRVQAQIASQRELLNSVLQANLALLSVRQNAVVRTISGWAAIIAVPTFLASIWGMNFVDMPELDQPWGYPLAIGLMAACVVALYARFKRIHWL
jgi:magnesium transporter